jgi:hypothetical protein
MFFVKHNVVSTIIHNLPTCIQRRVSSIYYSTDEKEFLSTLLFHALGLSFVDVQLVLVPKDILGLYLAKIFTRQYFSSINTSVESPLKPFFKNTKEIDQEMILD